MNNVTLALEGAWKVLSIGLLLGAGLPVLFALGVRSMAMAGGNDEPGRAPWPLGRALGILCFAIVIVAVLMGLTFIVASGMGKSLSFDHGLIPSLVSKK